ncbi:MAG: DUF2064 domain-containing protein, partial [Pseudomonadota bacterium]
MRPRGVVVVMVKAPVAGRVKTRLAADVGAGRAAALFRRFAERTVVEAVRSGRATYLAVDPPAACAALKTRFAQVDGVFAQRGGDLGARIRGAFASAPPGPICVIGADAPAMR